MPNCFQFLLLFAEEKMLVHSGNWSHPLEAMFSDGSNLSNSFFCRRTSSDNFYLIILNSDHQFQRRIFFTVFVSAISHAPSGHVV